MAVQTAAVASLRAPAAGLVAQVSTGEVGDEETTSSRTRTSLSSFASHGVTSSLSSSTSRRIATTRLSSTTLASTVNSTRSVSTAVHSRTSSPSTASSRVATTRRRPSTSSSASSASTRADTGTSRISAALSTESTGKAEPTSTLSTFVSSENAKDAKATASSPLPSTSSPRPSPTSYGYARTKNCTPPPRSFAGTDAGFASLCTVRYCDATARRNMVWSGNDGEVTRAEIESALGMLANLEPLWENGQGNVLADGYLGQGLYNAGLLFEITGDIRALDAVVRIADNILALQNPNTQDPVTIWTGDVDSVWPTGDLYPEDGKLVYAGCENGLIVGHMVSAAVMILKSPCLWDMVPPVFDGPTVFNESVTYYERAKAYIAAGDDTYESYFFRFLDPNWSIIQPADERWWLTGDSRAPGTPMPWNRRMMMVHGYLRLAAAHETAAAFDANITSKYDKIAQLNVGEFLADLNQSTAIRNGATTFNWDYSAGEDHTEESQGVHAYFDIWGSWISWQRSSAVFGVSNYIGQTFANTFAYTISFGNGTFSGLVTGSSTTKAYTINTLWGGWSFYALWMPSWFEELATSNVDVGFQGRTWLAIPLLWTKHALHVNDYTFWTGKFSSGYGEVVGTSSASSSGHMSSASFFVLRPITSGLVTLAALVAAIILLS
ncbi:hypothetical protein JCM10213_007949 [Rhodosporidiobolus nylandii]